MYGSNLRWILKFKALCLLILLLRLKQLSEIHNRYMVWFMTLHILKTQQKSMWSAWNCTSIKNLASVTVFWWGWVTNLKSEALFISLNRCCVICWAISAFSAIISNFQNCVFSAKSGRETLYISSCLAFYITALTSLSNTTPSISTSQLNGMNFEFSNFK